MESLKMRQKINVNIARVFKLALDIVDNPKKEENTLRTEVKGARVMEIIRVVRLSLLLKIKIKQDSGFHRKNIVKVADMLLGGN